MAPTSFPYYRPPDLDNTGAFTGEIRLDLRPLMGIPPKLSVHFLALLPGHRGTMRVRLFPNNGLQDVLITRSEGGDKVEVRFLCAATVVAQQVIEGLSKKWEGSPLMDSMKGGPECVFVGGLGEKGRQSWAGFIEEVSSVRLEKRGVADDGDSLIGPGRVDRLNYHYHRSRRLHCHNSRRFLL